VTVKKSLLILIWPAMAALAADSPAWLKSEFIYETAPFPQCHASTIVETQEGMAAAWFGGLREKSPDVGIWFSRRAAGAWTPPREVANGEATNHASGQSRRWPCWNPVLFQPAVGPLLLFYKVGPSPSQWWGMLKTSVDAGKSWSQARRLPEGILGPIKNKPIQLANGDILCGSSTEQNGWQVHFERSSDHGLTWTSTKALNDGRKIGAIQPSILRHPGGKLQALGRSKQDRLWETWSEDQGQTWTPLVLMDLPNPNAGTDAL
jgi:predicted neuraminidase